MPSGPSTPTRGSNSNIQGLLTPPNSQSKGSLGRTISNARHSHPISPRNVNVQYITISSEDDGGSDESDQPTPERISETIVVAPHHPPQPSSDKHGSLQSTPGRKTFSWDKVHFEGLYLLRTTFRGPWQYTTKVFSELFERHIHQQGLNKGPNTTALQVCWSKRGSGNPSLWKEVMQEIEDDPYAFDLLKLEIEYIVHDHTPMLRGVHRLRAASKPKITYNEVPRDKAHPPLPSVLFRSYYDKSQGRNSSQGFTASHFEGVEELPLPPVHSHPDLLKVIRMHMNIEHFKSPLISTSGSLARTIRLALRQKRKTTNPESCRISFIDTEVFSVGDRVFHAMPYKLELERKRRAFDKDKYRYKGSNEYLVWAGIPQNAIIRDVSLDELLRFCDGDLVLSRSLDMDMGARISWENLRRRFRGNGILLSPDLVAAIARLLSFLGLGVSGRPAMIARLVSEVVLGWCIVLEEQSPEAWIADAMVFAVTMVDLEDKQSMVPDEGLEELCGAFLDGLRTSVRHWWSHFENNSIEVDRMERQVAKLGLLPPITSRREQGRGDGVVPDVVETEEQEDI